MHSYSLEEARKIVMDCAKQYEKNLLNKNFIIIYRDKLSNQIKDLEVFFGKENYQHLTGIELIDEDGNIREHVSKLFFEKCIKNTLSKKEFQMKKDGTTNLKLQALPTIMEIHKVTKIAGDFDYSRPFLVADKVVGNINFCLGLKCINKFFVPVSALMENIKSITTNQSQVLAILSKETADLIYSNIRHVAKGLNLNNLVIPENIKSKITLENYVFKSK